MQTQPRPLRLISCFMFPIIIALLIIVFSLSIPALLTSKAEAIFGPPSPLLSRTQRLYLSALILFQSDDLTQPMNPGGEDVHIIINQGETIPSIVGKLWENGLISNPGVFRNYLQYSGLDTSLQAGEYNLSPTLPPVELAHSIQSSISPEVTLTILPGWRSEEIANSLQSSGLNITIEEFLQSVRSHPEGYSFSPCLNQDSLEGFLFPGSYLVLREISIVELLPQILMSFEAHINNELKSGISTQGLDLCQAVTLASVIQREAVIEEEMPIIASVFYNRLSVGTLLESDPTVQYALGFSQVQNTWWTNPLSLNDLQVDSPYNTYRYSGLPPGPISNPSLAALQAVAYPAQTPYYFFRSACDGSGHHVFAQTYTEHVSNECP